MTRNERDSVIAVVAACGAAGSALVIAAVDTITLRSRLVDEIATARPLWLHTFSIAMMTVGLAVARLVIARPFAPLGRIACGVLAVLNLTVPLLERDRPDLGPVLSIVHVVLAVMLLELALAAAPTTREHAPTAPITTTPTSRRSTHAHHH